MELPAMETFNVPASIIGFSGRAGAGKSTAARYLALKHGHTIVKFADPIKNMLRAIGIEEEAIEGGSKTQPHPLLCGQTPRYAMQTLGTEWGRDIIGGEFWTSLWANEVYQHTRVVADDVRFENEAALIKDMGGVLIEVQALDASAASVDHVSETLPFEADHVLKNAKDDTLFGLLDLLVAGAGQ